MNAAERKALCRLRKLAEEWPETLRLFSAGGSLYVMRCAEDGGRMILENGGMDPDAIVEAIDIPNDGGDW